MPLGVICMSLITIPHGFRLVRLILSSMIHDRVGFVTRTSTAQAARSTTPSPAPTHSTPSWGRPLSRSVAALSVPLFFQISTVRATMEPTRCSTQRPPLVDGSATPALRQSTVSLAVRWPVLLDTRVRRTRSTRWCVQWDIIVLPRRPLLRLALLERMRRARELPAWLDVSLVAMASTPLRRAPPSAPLARSTPTPL